MDLAYFKDYLFEALNESESLPIRNIDVWDRKNIFYIHLNDGSSFILSVQQIFSDETQLTSHE